MIIMKVGVHQHIMVRWWLTLMMVVVSLVCTNNMCRLTIKSGRYTIYKATSIPSIKNVLEVPSSPSTSSPPEELEKKDVCVYLLFSSSLHVHLHCYRIIITCLFS